MQNILVPVDDSDHALRAVEHLIRLHQAGAVRQVHLLNVQLPVASGHARLFLSHEALDEYHRDNGLQALQRARARLDSAGVNYDYHIRVGHPATVVSRLVREQGCDQVIMGTHGRSALTHLLLGSVASEVVRLVDVPVTLVK